jgi:hypothetical protein
VTDVPGTSSSPPSAPASATTPTPTRGPLRRWLGWIVTALGKLALVFVLLGMSGWAALAVYYSDLSGGASPRTTRASAVAVAFVAATIATVVGRRKKYGLAAFCVLFVAVLGWFLSLKPSNDRDWIPDVARAPFAEIDGDRITVRNIRDFDYRSETDFTPNWVDRTYDLSRLRSGDLMLCYWGSEAIAHAMVSFIFDPPPDSPQKDPQYLAVSIETRKEKGETYSAVQGFFRQYELVYVFADERDVIRVRTNYRHEDVYLYHTTVRPEKGRALLMSYVRRANSLAKEPEFYNALTSNCVTNVVVSAREIDPRATMGWEHILSGYAARRAYRNGRLDTSLPFEQLRAISRVNDAAVRSDRDPNFSSVIRRGLPVPAPRDASSVTNSQGGK